MENIIESAKQALANDIPVGLGTDASCPYITHYALWREVYYLSLIHIYTMADGTSKRFMETAVSE